MNFYILSLQKMDLFFSNEEDFARSKKIVNIIRKLGLTLALDYKSQDNLTILQLDSQYSSVFTKSPLYWDTQALEYFKNDPLLKFDEVAIKYKIISIREISKIDRESTLILILSQNDTFNNYVVNRCDLKNTRVFDVNANEVRNYKLNYYQLFKTFIVVNLKKIRELIFEYLFRVSIIGLFCFLIFLVVKLIEFIPFNELRILVIVFTVCVTLLLVFLFFLFIMLESGDHSEEPYY